MTHIPLSHATPFLSEGSSKGIFCVYTLSLPTCWSFVDVLLYEWKVTRFVWSTKSQQWRPRPLDAAHRTTVHDRLQCAWIRSRIRSYGTLNAWNVTSPMRTARNAMPPTKARRRPRSVTSPRLVKVQASISSAVRRSPMNCDGRAIRTAQGWRRSRRPRTGCVPDVRNFSLLSRAGWNMHVRTVHLSSVPCARECFRICRMLKRTWMPTTYDNVTTSLVVESGVSCACPLLRKKRLPCLGQGVAQALKGVRLNLAPSDPDPLGVFGPQSESSSIFDIHTEVRSHVLN